MRPAAAIGRLLDLHDVLEGRIGRPVIGEQQVGIADDRRQHVVEVMRDAAGKLSDRLHLLRLRELLLQLALLRGVERIDHRAATARFLVGREEEARRSDRRAGAVLEHRVDRLDVALSLESGDDRGLQRGAVALADAVEQWPAGIALGGRRLEGVGEEPGESGVGAAHASGVVERRDRHRRRIEEACEFDLDGAQILLRLLAGSAVERERARAARRAVLSEGDAMQEAHGQRAAIPALEIEIDLLRADLARRAGVDGEQRRAIVGDDVAQSQSAGAGSREIIAEPSRERLVHIRNGAPRRRGEKARRGVIEKVDCMLQLEEAVLLALAVGGDVGHRPERRALGVTLERADLDPIPAGLAGSVQRRREAQILDVTAPFARRLREPVDRLGDFRRPGEEPLDRHEAADVRRAAQLHVRFVRVDDLQIAQGDDQAFAARVGDELGQVVSRGAARELQQANSIGEEREDSRHREDRKREEGETRRLGGREEEHGRHAHQGDGEQKNEPGVAGPLGAVICGRCRVFGHAWRLLSARSRRPRA